MSWYWLLPNFGPVVASISTTLDRPIASVRATQSGGNGTDIVGAVSALTLESVNNTKTVAICDLGLSFIAALIPDTCPYDIGTTGAMPPTRQQSLIVHRIEAIKTINSL